MEMMKEMKEDKLYMLKATRSDNMIIAELRPMILPGTLRHRWVTRYSNLLGVCISEETNEPPIIRINNSAFPMKRLYNLTWGITAENIHDVTITYNGVDYEIGPI